MTPFVLSQITEEDARLFRKIRRAVEDLEDIPLGKDEDGKDIILSCHILARAVGAVFGLKHQDGYYYPDYQHTWLVTEDRSVIHVCPVAILRRTDFL